MKLRSLFIAIGLGCILCLIPLVAAYQLAVRPGSWLAGTLGAPTVQTQDSTAAQRLSQVTSTNPLSNTTTLLITKTASPAVVKAGELLTYTIVVSNTGSATAYNVAIYDELPPGLHFYGESHISVSNGLIPQIIVSAQRITGTVETLRPSGRIVLIGRTLVEPTAAGATLQNRAVVVADNSTNSNNQATVITELITVTPTPTPTPTATVMQSPTVIQTATTPPPLTLVPTAPATPSATPTNLPDLADLQLRKTAAHDPVIAGNIVTYTIQLHNIGPGPAHNVVLRDILPPGLFFEGNSALMILGGHTPTLQLSRNELTGTVTFLAAGGLMTITAPVRTPATAINQVLINQATVSATTPDPQVSNNNAGAPIILFPSSVLDRKNYLPLITH